MACVNLNIVLLLSLLMKYGICEVELFGKHITANHEHDDSDSPYMSNILRESTEDVTSSPIENVKHKQNILNDLKIALRKVKAEVKHQINLFHPSDEHNDEHSKETESYELATDVHQFASSQKGKPDSKGFSYSLEESKDQNWKIKSSNGEISDTILYYEDPDNNRQDALMKSTNINRDDKIIGAVHDEAFKNSYPSSNSLLENRKKLNFDNKNGPFENLVDSKGSATEDAIKAEHKKGKFFKNSQKSHLTLLLVDDEAEADLYTSSRKVNFIVSGQTTNEFMSYWNAIYKVHPMFSVSNLNDSLSHNISVEMKNESAQIIDADVSRPISKQGSLEQFEGKNATPLFDESERLRYKNTHIDIEELATGKEVIKDQLETYSQFAERVSAEKKNGGSSSSNHATNGQNLKGPKVKSKNYASTDCGAKLLAANSEASHSHKIINSNKDEYMLNKCTDKIWATVELCESIRPHKFDIANFELFSNLPKDIQLFGSHRYPTREWVSLGVYKGEEGNRDVQSFSIETEIFFKYIKIEVLSHYGTEFFCPVSLFRIYGMSEFEVIDQLEDIGTDEEPEFFELDKKEEKVKVEKPGMIPNVLKSMLSGILEVIKRGSRSSNESNEPEQFNIYTESCISLHVDYAISNDSCPMANSLNYILACYSEEYQKLMQHQFLALTVKNYDFCSSLANISCSSAAINDGMVYDTVCNNSYMCVMLSPKHILAMCHMYHPTILSQNKDCKEAKNLPSPNNYSISTSTLNVDGGNVTKYELPINDSIESEKSIDNVTLQKTLSADEHKVYSPIIHKFTEQNEDEENKEDSGNENFTQKVIKDSQKRDKVLKPKTLNSESAEALSKVSGDIFKEEKNERDSFASNISISNDPLLSNLPQGTLSPPTLIGTTGIPHVAGENRVVSTSANKESIVVRLSNKIKILEQNMSISSQYLEELSRRYKRQMEEMEHQFNITIMALNETSQTAYERDLHHQKYIESLESELLELKSVVANLAKERDTFLSTIVEQHLILFAIEIAILCLTFIICIRRRERDPRMNPARVVHVNGSVRSSSGSDSLDPLESSNVEPREIPSYIRRRSVDSIHDPNESKAKIRRLSGDVQSASGAYEHLLMPPIVPRSSEESSKDKKRKKRKSSIILKRSLSNCSARESNQYHSSNLSQKEKRNQEKITKSSAGVLFSSESPRGGDQRARSAVQELDLGKEDEGWNLVQSRRFSKVKNDFKDLDFYVGLSSENNFKNGISNKGINYTADLNGFEDANPYVCESMDLNLSSPSIFTVPSLDCNAPAVKSYYHASEGSQVYNTFGPGAVDLGADDQLTPIWTTDPEARTPRKSILLNDFAKLIPSCSSPIKGSAKLVPDNWHWISSQTSNVVVRERSSIDGMSKILSSTNSGVKSKTISSKTEKRRRKKKLGFQVTC